MRKTVLLVIFSFTVLLANAKSNGLNGELKGGVRIQKAQKLYWENGFCADYASSSIADGSIHFGASYATSRLGSAMGSNAIKQDNYLVSAAYHFRHQKQFQPFTRMNLGYFHADYEDAAFDDLPNSAFLFPIDAGLSYQFSFPLTLDLSVGYHFNAGDGTSGPGTLYPVFYQFSICYTILKNK